jgi:aspartate aminotransferase-like enzyme
MQWGRRFLPDAGEVRPEVLPELSQQNLAPDAVEELLALAQPRLQALFRTAEPIALLSAPAGMMREIGLRAAIEHRVLALIAGPQSAALADTAESLGAEVIRMFVHPGQTPEPEQLERFLASPSVDSVALVHVEPGTGTLAPLAELARVVRARRDLVLFVDASHSLGAAPLETDAWGLDFVLGTSDGPLALPPGLSFAAASSRLIARTRGLTGRGVLLDFLSHQAAAAEGTLLAPIDPHQAVALDRQLARIEREGLTNRWARHQAMADEIAVWVGNRSDVTFVARAGRRSPVVSCLTLPSRVTGSIVAESLLRQGWTVAVGDRPESASIIRIGHMGEVGLAELRGLLTALEQVLDGGGG